jgi:hypothetical protein
MIDEALAAGDAAPVSGGEPRKRDKPNTDHTAE